MIYCEFIILVWNWEIGNKMCLIEELWTVIQLDLNHLPNKLKKCLCLYFICKFVTTVTGELLGLMIRFNFVKQDIFVSSY